MAAEKEKNTENGRGVPTVMGRAFFSSFRLYLNSCFGRLHIVVFRPFITLWRRAKRTWRHWRFPRDGRSLDVNGWPKRTRKDVWCREEMYPSCDALWLFLSLEYFFNFSFLFVFFFILLLLSYSFSTLYRRYGLTGPWSQGQKSNPDAPQPLLNYTYASVCVCIYTYNGI